jgi:enoyl-CoA hydratase/carnithine racemase
MIHSHRDGTTMTLVIDSSPHNHLAPADIITLGESLTQASYDTSLGAVIVKGNGENFCAGRVSGDDPSPEARAREFEAVLRIGRVIDTMPQIVIAAVEGRAWGLGLGLTIQSDVAIAARDSDFALPELSHGLPPLIILSYLHRFVPYKVGLEWVLSGRSIGLDELMGLGVVTRHCGRGEAYEEAADFAKQLEDRREAAMAAKVFARGAAGLLDGNTAGLSVREIVSYCSNANGQSPSSHVSVAARSAS